MENATSDVADYLQSLRERLLQDGEVNLIDDTTITRVEAKKKVLWHLGVLAAELAGAEKHIALFQNDNIFTQAEKDRMENEILDGLKKKLRLEEVIKDYSYCLRRHFQHLVDDDYPVVFGDDTREVKLERRKVIYETLTQLELIARDLDELCIGLYRAATT
jgi:hypothetical protein